MAMHGKTMSIAVCLTLLASVSSMRRVQSVTNMRKASVPPGREAGVKTIVGPKHFPDFPKPFSIDPMRVCTGYWEVGCFKDTLIDARFYYSEHVPKEDRELMTPEVCFNFCRNTTGVQAFGLLEGRECYCTPHFSKTRGEGGEAQCDEICEGDNSKMCGGMTKSLIYEMHDCNNLPATPCDRAPALVENAKVFVSRHT